LGILYPELYGIQVRAIVRAACELKQRGLDPKPEIMIPLVSVEPELAILRAESEAIIAEIFAETGVEVDIIIGTMIELPRAAVCSDEIAGVADFFSFGTNDLTQTAFGFSRDDVESKFMPQYLERKVVPVNPFETIDDGVMKLVEMSCEGGRKTNPGIKLGVCGEHGGDPDSINKFFKVGLDYVSCSPYRVPVARLAAARATIGEASSNA
jgi:pyruvate,orthophosphate dikinase